MKKLFTTLMIITVLVVGCDSKELSHDEIISKYESNASKIFNEKDYYISPAEVTDYQEDTGFENRYPYINTTTLYYAIPYTTVDTVTVVIVDFNDLEQAGQFNQEMEAYLGIRPYCEIGNTVLYTNGTDLDEKLTEGICDK